MNSLIHEVVRDLHNLMRWLILLAAANALFVNYRGWITKRPWTTSTRTAGLLFSTLLHVQILVAIALYTTSPLTQTAWADIGLAMANRDQRFFSIEHPTQMLLAIGLATFGSLRAKRADSDTAKFKQAALYYSVSVLLILTVIPWPFLSHQRPWMPQLSWIAGSRK